MDTRSRFGISSLTRTARLAGKLEINMTRKQLCKRLTITVRGNDDSDLDLAIDEAVKAIKTGYQTGHNSNDTGAYYFDTTDDLPKGEYPA